MLLLHIPRVVGRSCAAVFTACAAVAPCGRLVAAILAAAVKQPRDVLSHSLHLFLHREKLVLHHDAALTTTSLRSWMTHRTNCIAFITFVYCIPLVMQKVNHSKAREGVLSVGVAVFSCCTQT